MERTWKRINSRFTQTLGSRIGWYFGGGLRDFVWHSLWAKKRHKMIHKTVSICKCRKHLLWRLDLDCFRIFCHKQTMKMGYLGISAITASTATFLTPTYAQEVFFEYLLKTSFAFYFYFIQLYQTMHLIFSYDSFIITAIAIPQSSEPHLTTPDSLEKKNRKRVQSSKNHFSYTLKFNVVWV